MSEIEMKNMQNGKLNTNKTRCVQRVATVKTAKLLFSTFHCNNKDGGGGDVAVQQSAPGTSEDTKNSWRLPLPLVPSW